VAAGVQHDDGAGWRGLQRRQHVGHAHASRGGVVVGIGLDGEAGVGEQRAVVLPAGVADQHLGAGLDPLQEVGADLQATGAAQGLHGGHAAFGQQGRAGAEYQPLHGLVVGGDAVDGQVALGLGRLEQLLLGRRHALQHRQLALVVEIDADAEVDLGRVGVGGKLFVEAEDGVARRHLDGGEQGSGSGHRAVLGGGVRLVAAGPARGGGMRYARWFLPAGWACQGERF